MQGTVSRMARSALAGVVICAVMAGCGGGDVQKEQQRAAELERLKKENAALRAELEEIKTGAPRLIAEAEAAAAKSDWAVVKAATDKLLAKHAGTPEAARAKPLADQAATAIAKAEREAQQAQAKKDAEEKAAKAAEERRLATAVAKMNKRVDKVDGMTWYRDKSSPAYTNANGFFLYIGKPDSGSPFLRFRVQYHADSWLFIENFIVVADGVKFEYPAERFERDNDSEIWEWRDQPARSDDLAMLRAVIASKEAMVRFNGKQYRRDKPITAAQKQALQNVLDAYKALGGT